MSTYLWELRKLAAQRRTLFGLIAAALIPATFAIGLAINPADPGSGRGDAGDLLSVAYNSSGLVLPFVALIFSSLVLLPLLAALVAGDIVAAEDVHRTLKTVLTRSVSRLQLLLAKMAATATYVVVLLVVFGVAAYLIGGFAAGFHPVRLGQVQIGSFTLQAPPISVGSISTRIVLTLLFYAPPLLSVSAWGFLFSTLTRNSGASIVGMLVFSFTNQIIGYLPGIPDSVTRWLLSGQFTAWEAAVGTTITWGPLWHAALVSAIYGVPPLLFSAWWFGRRDVLV